MIRSSARVRREHLVEAGKLIRLKHDVKLFARTLDTLADGYKFDFHVISAAPQEIIQVGARRHRATPKIFTAPSFTTSRATVK